MKRKTKTNKPPAPPAPGVARERLQKVQAQFAQENADAARRMAPVFKHIGNDWIVEVEGERIGKIVPGRWVFQRGRFDTTLDWINHPAGVDAAVERRIADGDAVIRAAGPNATGLDPFNTVLTINKIN